MALSKRVPIALVALGFYLSETLFAQSTGQTVRHHKVAEQSTFPPELTQAEAAIEKSEYASAEPLLTKVISADPGNY